MSADDASTSVASSPLWRKPQKSLVGAGAVLTAAPVRQRLTSLGTSKIVRNGPGYCVNLSVGLKNSWSFVLEANRSNQCKSCCSERNKKFRQTCRNYLCLKYNYSSSSIKIKFTMSFMTNLLTSLWIFRPYNCFKIFPNKWAWRKEQNKINVLLRRFYFNSDSSWPSMNILK